MTFDPGCVKAVRDAAERLGYSTRIATSSRAPATTPAGSTASRADGHDHVSLRRRLSHNEAEEIYPEWAAAAATSSSMPWSRRR